MYVWIRRRILLKMVSYAFLSPNKFGDFVDPIELEIKDTTRSVSFLDIRFKIDSEGRNFMLVSSFLLYQNSIIWIFIVLSRSLIPQSSDRCVASIIGSNTIIEYIFKSYTCSVYYVFILIHKYWKRIFELYPKYVQLFF